MSRVVALALLVVATSLLVVAPPSLADPAQTNFVESQAFGGLTQPTDIGFSPDGRVFVAEKSGLVKVFDNLNDTSATVVADLRTNVHNFWDRGLLGMALDPQFPQRPYVYLLYTHDALIGGTAPRWGTPGATADPCPNPPGATGNGCVVSGRLSRVQLSGNIVVGGEQVLVEDWCQQFPSHSIGGLAFGSDGALYVTGGDGASFNYTDYGQTGNPCGDPPVPVGGTQSPPNAQGGALRSQDIRTTLDPTTLDGSVLRVDPDTGAGLPNNPLSGSTDPNARRVVATGLRNPFRLAPRPGTSQMFVGDVGWSSWEEINRIDSATDGSVDNFGWPCYEGNGRQGGYDGANLTICEDLYAQPAATRQPLFTYSHGAPVVSGDSCATGGSSSAGLAFYQGGAYPASYDGALFFADYSRKCVWVMFEQGGQPLPSTRQLFARNVDPVNLKIGPGGDLFIVDFNGSIRRITYSSNNQPPTAVAQATPTTGPLPLTVSFNGGASTDPDAGDSLSYAWDLDADGLFDDSFSAQASRTYTAQGAVTVRLRVTDSSGEFDTDSVEISPGGDPPQATIATPAPTLRWAVGDAISFSGSASDAQQGTLPDSALTWALTLEHCTTVDDCHSHTLGTWEGISGGPTARFDAPDHPYPSHLELSLTATDSSGLTDTETVRLDPRTVDLTFRTQPSGLRLAVGSTEETTPFTRTVIVGSRNSVSAPSSQALGATTYRFASWSDGGAQAHEVVAPSSASTYTANYEVDATPPSGLVGAFGFNEGSGVSVGDASPEGNVGTVSGASWSAAGRFGGALSFDGVNDWVTVADDPSLDLSGALTLEAWVRPSGGSGFRTVVLKEHPGRFAYALYASRGDSSGDVFTNNFYTASGPALAADSWSHLAVTLSQGSLRLYVNGNLVSTSAVPGTMADATGPLRIGGNAIWSEYFGGLIDELRVYNRALTPAEIQTDMGLAIAPDNSPPGAPPNLTASGGLGQVALDWDAASDNVGVTAYHVHRGTSAGFTPALGNRVAVVSSGTAFLDTGLTPGEYFYRVTAVDAADNAGPASNEARGTATADTEPPSVALSAPADGARVSGTIDVRATASDNASVAGVQFLLNGQPLGPEDTSAPYERSFDTRTAPNGAHQLSARARDGAGNQRTSAAVGVTVDNSVATPPSGLVGAFGFNEGSGVSVGDASPEGNVGTVSGASWSAAGRFGGALSFDGVNDWVTVADDPSLDLSGALTLEAWVRPSGGSGFRTVVLKEHPGRFAYALYASRGDSSGDVFTNNFYTASGPALAADSWSHLAVTLSQGSLRLYVNGNLVSTSAVPGTMADATGPLRIGGNAIWSEYFGGLIDELRVYNRALTPAEIQTDLSSPVAP